MDNILPEFTVSADLTDVTISARNEAVIVCVKRTLHPFHVKLDSPTYIETKWRKTIPALWKITVEKAKTGAQVIAVHMKIKGEFNRLSDILSLAKMGGALAKLAEDRLSEPEVVHNIASDCKPWFNEDEKDKAN